MIPVIQSLSPMKNADPLAPMAIGRHSDSPTTKASAMSPVAHPMSATPSSHVAVFSHEFLVLPLRSDMFWGFRLGCCALSEL